ncbi:hypothetical protein ABBQ38_005674 [Trebouxia sp. C0009 RCD-2024]
MTRRISVQRSVLAARSSFWEALPQDAAKAEARRTGSDHERAPGLYDQLVHLKDWREETAELCSAVEARREDSAMRLSSGTRPSLSSSNTHSSSGLAARTSSSSQGIIPTRDRSFCRSSFSAARPYETREPRQRPRTFAMEELHPSSSSAVRLEEVTQPVGLYNQHLPAGGKKQNSLLSMAASSLSAADDMLRSIMKSAFYQTTGRMQSAS